MNKEIESTYAIEVMDVVKNYGKENALDGISFTVNKGEIFGLVGTNGAGKSTFLKILSTIIRASSGNVNVYGFDVHNDSDEVRKCISYLPEVSSAYNYMKGIDYLTYISKIFDKRNYKEILMKGIEIADLDDDINKKISKYSKGMERKINIARALMVDAKLLVLDEFTSGLDVINAHKMRKIVKSSINHINSVLISTHNMSEVEFLCDRIALINEGRIYEIGNPQDLKSKYSCDTIEDVFVKVLK
jgi:ABC-2 type transport system ATP-binding protein